MNGVDRTVKAACTYVGVDVDVSMLEQIAVTRFRRYGATPLRCMPLCTGFPWECSTIGTRPGFCIGDSERWTRIGFRILQIQ